MAYLRKLASGRWQATVRLPDGQRRSYSHRLKSAVQAWAAELERDARHGEAIDPRLGETTVGELWQRAREARRLELASRRRDDSHWRCHVAPAWADTPAGAILRPDITTWVVRMETEGVGAATIQGALGVLRAVLDHAVDARLIRDNPARGVSGPRRPAHQDRVLADHEDNLLLSALDRTTPVSCPTCGRMLWAPDGLVPEHRQARKPCPGAGEPAPSRPDARLAVELMLHCGLRWEEVGAIRREAVLLQDALIQVGPVVERDGTIRPYPKSPAGERAVPVPDHLLPRLRVRVLATGAGGLVIPSPGGGVLDYSRWYHRVWAPALGGLPERAAARGRGWRPEIVGAGLADPQPTPHDLRHTYGTRLAEAGVPPHEIMALMGHESLGSTQRYVHAREGRFTRARAAMALVHSRSASSQRHELK